MENVHWNVNSWFSENVHWNIGWTLFSEYSLNCYASHIQFRECSLKSRVDSLQWIFTEMLCIPCPVQRMFTEMKLTAQFGECSLKSKYRNKVSLAYSVNVHWDVMKSMSSRNVHWNAVTAPFRRMFTENISVRQFHCVYIH